MLMVCGEVLVVMRVGFKFLCEGKGVMLVLNYCFVWGLVFGIGVLLFVNIIGVINIIIMVNNMDICMYFIFYFCFIKK